MIIFQFEDYYYNLLTWLLRIVFEYFLKILTFSNQRHAIVFQGGHFNFNI